MCDQIDNKQNFDNGMPKHLGQLASISEVSDGLNIEKGQNVCSFKPGHLASLGGVGEVSSGLSVLGSVGDLFRTAYGSEGRVDIKITNKLNDNLTIQLVDGKNRDNKEILLSGMTRIYSKKARDGLGHTTKYQCDFWYQNKHARIFVYGARVPRKDNLIEVREDGFFLIELPHEFHVSKWDQVCC